MHVCRCVLFAEFMCRYYCRGAMQHPALTDVRYAVAFHDAGRRQNGPDLWEHDSTTLCSAYLTQHPRSISRSPAETAALIAAKGRPRVLEERIVHDADVLDIMRPCCGHGGRQGFWEEALLFLGEADEAAQVDAQMRSRLIDEAWQFISTTEDRKSALRGSRDYMGDVLNLLAAQRASCPMLCEGLL
jgi:hypothetical protein